MSQEEEKVGRSMYEVLNIPKEDKAEDLINLKEILSFLALQLLYFLRLIDKCKRVNGQI